MEASQSLSIKEYMSYVSLLLDTTASNEDRKKAVQKINADLEVIINSFIYPEFLKFAMETFIKVLQNGKQDYIIGFQVQVIRTSILQIIHRFPLDELLKSHTRNLITTILKILQMENEECALICLRIISDLENVYHALLTSEVRILDFIRIRYQMLPGYVNEIFKQRPSTTIKKSEVICVEKILSDTFITTSIEIEDESNIKTQYNLLPRATLSLKVFAELPAVLLLIFQSRKVFFHQDIAELIPSIMVAITLKPPSACRNDNNRKKPLFHFVSIQVTTLSFLAYVVPTHKQIIKSHSDRLVLGILQLLHHCPVELTHFRKDLLISLKQILATDLRDAFVDSVEELLDETLLIGTGWSVKEHLRPLAYSIIGDFLHHVGGQLSFKDLNKAVTMFSEFLHDESLSITLHAMASRILLNLVDFIPSKAANSVKEFDLLLKLLEVFILRCKTLTKLQLPILRKKCQMQKKKVTNVTLSPNVTTSVSLSLQPRLGSSSSVSSSLSEDASIQGSQSSVAAPSTQQSSTESRLNSIDSSPMLRFPESQMANCNVGSCQNLLKLLVHGVKAIACNTDKIPKNQVYFVKFQQKETHVYTRFMKYAFKAFDLFTLSDKESGTISKEATLSNEQKDIVDTFANVFSIISPSMFHEIFTLSIDCIVNRMIENPALHALANSLLATRSTSVNFASILLEYLLGRMKEMGSNKALSDSYLILFKLVIGSVSLFQPDNEIMLKSYLHQIVNKAMEFSLSATDPFNYFLLLRALFRFIGSGCYPHLYEGMLVLLPNLLRRLKQFQSCPHLKNTKDILIELCLNIPIKFNALREYMPRFMDPIISGLNSSDSLAILGLQTLEIFLDELEQKDLHNNIDPVRSELMPAIWNHLNNPDDSIAEIAFKVLGKLGGESRSLTGVIQKLNYSESTNDGPSVKVDFINRDLKSSIALPIGKIIETASEALKLQSVDLFYLKQSWNIIQGFLSMNIAQDSSSVDIHRLLLKLNSEELKPTGTPWYQCFDMQTIKIHETALASMYYALAIKKLKPVVLPFSKNVVRHYTLLMVVQQSGIFCNEIGIVESRSMNPLILIDALATVMRQGKELRKLGSHGLKSMLDSVATFLSSKPKVSELPFYKYLAEKMSALCYERACSAKIAGCVAIKLLMMKYPLSAIYMHLCMFTKALLFVMDLEDEVSFGAADMAKNILEKLLKFGAPISSANSSKDLLEEQERAVNDVAQELFQNLMIPNAYAQQQVIHLLKLLAEVSNKSVEAVIEPCQDLTKLIPPKSSLLMHPHNAQIAILNGITFCISLPTLPNGKKLFPVDSQLPHYQRLLKELIFICKGTDADLMVCSSYKLITDFIPLKKAALQTLAALWLYNSLLLVDQRPIIFNTCFQVLASPCPDLQEMAFNCLKQLDEKWKTEILLREVELSTIVDMKLKEQKATELEQEKEKKQHMIQKTRRNFLNDFANCTKLDLPRMQQLDYVVQLYTVNVGNAIFELLFQCLQKWLELLAIDENKREEKRLCIAVINIFHKVPALSKIKIKPLLMMLMDRKLSVKIEVGDLFYKSVVKFLQCGPLQTMEYFIQEKTGLNVKACLFLKHLLKGDSGKPFREILKMDAFKNRLAKLAYGNLSLSFRNFNTVGLQLSIVLTARRKIQYLAISIISFLVKYDDEWLSQEWNLVTNLHTVWVSTISSTHYFAKEGVDFIQWNEPKMLLKCFLNFAKHNPDEISFLFQLLRAFTGKFISDFEFLRDFFKNIVAKQYSVKWKRKAFFTFVKMFHYNSFTWDLKAKILQYVLIPSFAIAFENGEELALVEGDPSSKQDCTENVVHVFIKKLINPDVPHEPSETVCVLLLQFSCLLVENASKHIQSADASEQSSKLKRLWKYVQPRVQEIFIDPAVTSHRLLLAARIVTKISIMSSFTEQVLQDLLRTPATVAWPVVKHALDILIAALPQRMEDGNKKLIYWTRKIINDGCSLTQFSHLLQLLVQYRKIYYSARHQFINHMVNSLLKLEDAPYLKHKKLAVDIAEMIIQWTLQQRTENQESRQSVNNQLMDIGESSPTITKAYLEIIEGPSLRKITRISYAICSKPKPDSNDSVNRHHSNQIVNFLLRTACQVSQTEIEPLDAVLPQRCICLLKTGLQELWPDAKLDELYINTLLETAVEKQSKEPNFTNVSAALDLLADLLTVLKDETVLPLLQSLLNGISACLTCNDSKVVKSTHNLLSRLISLFPPKPGYYEVSSTIPELDMLYMTIFHNIHNCLQKFEKSACSYAALHDTLMILRAVSLSNPCYVACMMEPLMKMLLKVFKEHIGPVGKPNKLDTSILILSFKLLENTVGVMTKSMRMTFIGTILVELIKKSPSPNVLKAIIAMIEYWVKCKTPAVQNQIPSIIEKSILLVKMMQFIEKRFPNELELNVQFLNLVFYICSHPSFKETGLPQKLECAFMPGMRCMQPLVRTQFFKVYSCTLSRLLPERLLYIISSQDWSNIGPHFWIKQFIELLFATAVQDSTIQSTTMEFMLPSLTCLLSKTNPEVDHNCAVSVEVTNELEHPFIGIGQENGSLLFTFHMREQVHIKCSKKREHRDSESATTFEMTQSSQEQVNVFLCNHIQFLESLKVIKVGNFLTAVAQLCHMDTALAEHVWLMLFPRLWAILPEDQQQEISVEIEPFLLNSIHVLQKHCHPSATGVFTDSVIQCIPRISLDAKVLSYLGKSHNVWHRSATLLEELSFDENVDQSSRSSKASDMDLTNDKNHPELYITPQQKALDNLNYLYSHLKEEDLLCALWQRRSLIPETVCASRFEQQGLFQAAEQTYTSYFRRGCQKKENIPLFMQSEGDFLLIHMLRCWKELNDWKSIREYNSKTQTFDPYMELENCWQDQVWYNNKDWTPMRDALKCLVDGNYPEENAWKVKYYEGHLAIQCCGNDVSHVDGLAQMASNLCIKEWRRFPRIISYCHLPILQAAQQTVELQEAAQMHHIGSSFHPDDAAAVCNFIIMLKTWENRPPALSDDFSYWNDLLIWRQLFCQKMIRRYNPNALLMVNQSLQLPLWNDALASSYTQVVKIARKQGFPSLGLDMLQKVNVLGNIPLWNSFQNLMQEYKCLLQIVCNIRKHKPEEAKRILTNAIAIIDGKQGQHLTKPMLGKASVFHGVFLSQLGNAEEANKVFSASSHLNKDSAKTWVEWGNFMEQKFLNTAGNPIRIGEEVLTCFLRACKHQNEIQSRKYIAKILWLLNFDDEEMHLAVTFQKLSKRVPLMNWIPWVPQLLMCLSQNEGSKIVDIINEVGSAYPQVVYFPLRTLYSTLKPGNRESGGAAMTNDCNQATAALLLCNRIIIFLKSRNPNIIAVLDRIIAQMACLRGNTDQEVLGQLRQALTQCYSTFFKHAETGVETVIMPHLLKLIQKMVSKFDAGLKKGSTLQRMPTAKSPARKVQESPKLLRLNRVQREFSVDFNFSALNAMTLHSLIIKLRIWMTLMERKNKFSSSSHLMDQKFRFLINFSEKTANIELPGELLMPKLNHVCIAQFMPRVDVVYKQNAPAQRLYIRGTDGKVYPYLVFNNDDLSTDRHEERVLQLLRMLDMYLKKQKETSRRFLAFTIPKVVSLSANTYLVEDNVSSVSLLDIFQQICEERNTDNNVQMYNFYDHLAAFQFSGKPVKHQVLCDLFKDAESVGQRNSLKKWVERTYPDAADYWTFRKQFTVQLSMIAFIEYVLHLSRLNPDMMYIHRDSGLVNVSYFKFDIDHGTGELNTSQPVPFRLTPNITEFMTPLGISGPFTASMIAAAQCLLHPNYHVTSLLRAILRDEVIAAYKKCNNPTHPTNIESKMIITMVTKAVSAITTRLESLVDIGPDGQAQKLVAKATNIDNLCHMDLTWQPWL